MVAFEDNFWGEKYNGFELLHTNFKQGIVASKEFLEYVKERISVEEAYAKSLLKVANKCPTAFGHIGTFEPCWKFVQSSTEKLASSHLQVVQNLNEVVKALKEYNETQKEKHRQVKDEFGIMSEMVQSMQALNTSVVKAKEAYQARSQEAEKLRKDCNNTKDIPALEKAEKKVEKSCEEYKNVIEKREATRVEYEKKFTETAMKFQSMEHDHLNELLAYLGKYGNCLTTERVLLTQIIEEFSINMDAFRVSSLLEQFVCSKQTGKDKPVPMEFEEVVISVPPVDVAAITSKEVEKRKAKKERKTRKKKEKSTANGSLQTQEGQQKAEVGIDVDEDGYSIRPPDADNASLKSGKSRDSFSSNSGSDSDDDEPRKIQVKIKPKEDTQTNDVSIDALKTLSAGLTLSSPGTIHKKSNSALDLKSKNLSRSNNALLDLEHSSNSDTASIKSLPSSSSLDMFQPTFLSTMSGNTSKDNSVGDLDNLFNAGVFHSTPSIHSDWASELGVAQDVPKSTSETKADTEDVPPPLPTKHRSTHEESATLPRSSKLISTGDNSSTEAGGHLNGGASIDKPVAIPRVKTISGGQPAASQFPALAPPVSNRRNTSSARLMQNRPLPPPPQPAQQQQKPQSSMLDLMDIFTTPAPSVTSSLTGQQQSVIESFQSSPPQTASSATPAGNAESSASSSPSSIAVENQQTQITSTSVASAANTSTVSSPSMSERATPIAVALIESVNARLKLADQIQPMVKITGDMTISFPATIVPLLLHQENPTVLKFDIHGTNSLEQILPNKRLVEKEGQLPGGDTLCYKFNMAALTNYLKEQSEKNIASYYNIDIIKYQVRSNGVKSIPLQLRSYWRCDEKMTDLKIDYEHNPVCVNRLSNVTVIVPVDGGVEIMHSKPSATWSGEHQRATWKIPTISENSENKGSGCLRARFEVSSGPSTPTAIAVQFSSEGSTISNMSFDLKSPGYKLSLVKKKVVTGRYFAEPVTIADKA